ncbi:hypothetical protein M427DRAFT_70374 [Gonapodya prolifera JEL478]|uniref:Uncharacterized protein n=1 Tax=Gonapodya prolifera (strain JEL478) TaxID=1344416 RepID=A0A139ADC1_GONPJ|nr:hypothetical protein M427DRAFT_70374 [Gonapodya prolifera JEL478]|eukprot:KXS14812.1 hypothetical protein M427DRAFT_70374 [Gonapodya prolifera JEL478]
MPSSGRVVRIRVELGNAEVKVVVARLGANFWDVHSLKDFLLSRVKGLETPAVWLESRWIFVVTNDDGDENRVDEDTQFEEDTAMIRVIKRTAVTASPALGPVRKIRKVPEALDNQAPKPPPRYSRPRTPGGSRAEDSPTLRAGTPITSSSAPYSAVSRSTSRQSKQSSPAPGRVLIHAAANPATLHDPSVPDIVVALADEPGSEYHPTTRAKSFDMSARPSFGHQHAHAHPATRSKSFTDRRGIPLHGLGRRADRETEDSDVDSFLEPSHSSIDFRARVSYEDSMPRGEAPNRARSAMGHETTTLGRAGKLFSNFTWKKRKGGAEKVSHTHAEVRDLDSPRHMGTLEKHSPVESTASSTPKKHSTILQSMKNIWTRTPKAQAH